MMQEKSPGEGVGGDCRFAWVRRDWGVFAVWPGDVCVSDPSVRLVEDIGNIK